MATDTENKSDLWSLVLDSVRIDPRDLAVAIDAEAANPSHDFRTRVLVRDSYFALKNQWGEELTRSALSPATLKVIDAILIEDLGQKGFASLKGRLMEQTPAQTIELPAELTAERGVDITKCNVPEGRMRRFVTFVCDR